MKIGRRKRDDDANEKTRKKPEMLCQDYQAHYQSRVNLLFPGSRPQLRTRGEEQERAHLKRKAGQNFGLVNHVMKVERAAREGLFLNYKPCYFLFVLDLEGRLRHISL